MASPTTALSFEHPLLSFPDPVPTLDEGVLGLPPALRPVKYPSYGQITGKPIVPYLNGTVLSNVEISPIFFNASATFQSDMISFYKFLPTSSYMTTLLEYNTPSQTIGYGKYITSYVEFGSIKPKIIDSVDIQPYLRNLVFNGTISPNENSYYPVHLSPGVSISHSINGQSCVDFCGYHGYIYVADVSTTAEYLVYGVMPDLSGACKYSCGDGTILQNLQSVSSHEAIEAITDPLLDAWWHPTYGEVGDLCNAIKGTLPDSTGKLVTVQKVWSNRDSKCVVTANVTTVTDVTTSTTTQNTPATATPSLLTYKGGPLLSNPEVSTVFYGENSLQSRIEEYYSFITDSSWMNIFSEYSTAGYQVGRGTFKTSVVEINPQLKALDVTTDIVTYLRNLVISGRINPNSQSYYAFHVAPNINVSYYGRQLCVNTCSVTGVIDISDISPTHEYLRYGVLPDFANCSVCGRSPDSFSNLAALSSVQLAQSVVNGGAGVGKAGWTASNGGIADLGCYWKQYPLFNADRTKSFTVQKLWSNKYQKIQQPIHQEQVTSIYVTTKTAPSKLMTYYRGPLIASADVTILFYGSSGIQGRIKNYYSYILNSTWMDTLTQYNTSTIKITAGKLSGTYTENDASLTSLEVVKDIEPYLRSLVSTGKIKPTANTFYPIHFGQGISIFSNGKQFCKGACSYYPSVIDISDISSTKYLFYGVIPDPTGCNYCGKSVDNFNNMVMLASAQLAQAVVNPAMNKGAFGWYLSGGGGISDFNFLNRNINVSNYQHKHSSRNNDRKHYHFNCRQHPWRPAKPHSDRKHVTGSVQQVRNNCYDNYYWYDLHFHFHYGHNNHFNKHNYKHNYIHNFNNFKYNFYNYSHFNYHQNFNNFKDNYHFKNDHDQDEHDNKNKNNNNHKDNYNN
ncbi:hypothetical protein BJ741DRAFT_579834 [Chytriomyces cf. hyalinus JEL632]|nr:hypothetical protein BJ741DRAFT_579834 [Chytriomyces cf. hyalinus JEL632]